MTEPPAKPGTTGAVWPELFLDTDTLVAFGIALGLGLLVGLQRERTAVRLGGIRTFPLIALFGAMVARTSQIYDAAWLMAIGLLCMVVLILLGNLERLRGEAETSGVTTEVTALLMFLLGVLLVVGDKTLAVVAGGTITVLLHLKPSMHRFAQRLSENDLRAIMRFALISLIILPVLPNQTFGPYDVLNPFKIWLLVVLIVGIGLGGYGLYKLVGAQAGTLLSGVIGGLISSTATTVSYAQRVRNNDTALDLAALVILIASTTMFVRIFVEISVVAPHILGQLAPPLAALMAVSVAVCGVGYRTISRRKYDIPAQSNPAELGSALIFACLYAAVLLGIAAGQEYLGNRGTYLVAMISGFADVDAITLSSANLAGEGLLEPATALRAIVIATLANLAFKAVVGGILGGRALFRRLILLFALPFCAGLAVVFLWPQP
ncbi:MgtC/SapB family protein [Microbulbifer sp. TYP-18]|uniref:MgtC/SapB family protein n=1 Tax=Microbulbifer sp. TYP-18 TaxID=3230024 RepID=UPI0034C5D427